MPPTFTRPLGLSRWMGRMRSTAPAPAAAPRAAAVPTLEAMRDELRARLLVHDPATQAVRHLYVVYKQLGIGGWAAAGSLPHAVIHRALAEAEMMETEDPSPLLGFVIERIRAIDSLAEVLAESEPAAPATRPGEWAPAAVPEVSETSYDEYELMERSWIGTVPSGLLQTPPDTAPTEL